MPVSSEGRTFAPGPAHFATTHWSVVLQAGIKDSPRAEAALAEIYRAYWYPLYAFVRGRGYEMHDAQDIAQDFFAALLKKNYLDCVNRDKGRFRSYLLGALKHFLTNEWHKANREKRGGKHTLIALDEMLAEDRWKQEPAHDATPEKIYERNWAETLLERIVLRLRSEHDRAGKGRHFEVLKVFLSGEKNQESYARIALQLDMSAAAVKVAVYRLRQRYRELLRAEIASTVVHPGEVEDELRYLVAVLRG